MKVFILFILMIDINGNETIDRVNTINYSSRFSCLVDKAVYSRESVIPNDDKTTYTIRYFCADKSLYNPKPKRKDYTL